VFRSDDIARSNVGGAFFTRWPWLLGAPGMQTLPRRTQFLHGTFMQHFIFSFLHDSHAVADIRETVDEREAEIEKAVQRVENKIKLNQPENAFQKFR